MRWPHLRAAFAPLQVDQVNLLVDYPFGRQIQIDPHKPAYTAGEEVTLTVLLEQGEHFLGWTGDVTDPSPVLMLNLDQSLDISARLRKIPESDGRHSKVSGTEAMKSALAKSWNAQREL